jgi:methylated-DNA-[protein]-cysteine S-methyltransferase
MEKINVFSSPVGDLLIKIANDKLAGLEYVSEEKTVEFALTDVPNSHLALFSEVKKQLQQYFGDGKFRFSLPLELVGTSLQKKIWQELTLILSGETTTYGSLAKKLKTGPRIIGNACRSNPIAIVIPCHRVVGVSSLGGYSGQTKGKLFDVKKWLLNHEGKRRG